MSGAAEIRLKPTHRRTLALPWLLTALYLGPLHIAAAQAPAPAAQAADEEADATAPPRRPTRPARPTFRFGVDGVLAEAAALPDAPDASSLLTLRATPYAQWQPARGWELRAGVRLGAVAQRGGPSAYDDTQAELADTYVRYSRGDTRLTVGAQTVLWGRVDAVPLIDRVSRVDLSRIVLDDLAERRLPQPVVRWEQTIDDWKLDGVLLPYFRAAVLPDERSVWSPIDRRSGRVLGLPETPAIAAFARHAPVRERVDGSGGAAVRITRTGEPLDFGLTLARTRQPLPYYRLNPAGPALDIVHPHNRFLGADLEVVAGGVTYRSELGMTTDVPLTRPDGVMVDARAFDWIGAVEFFPGGKDTRVNVQLLVRKLRADAPVLEITRYVGINGEVQTTLGQGRWKLGMKFFSGLNVHDLYLAPRLSFVGWEPHELYVQAHHFRGESRTLGGFYRERGMLAIGLKTRF
ncbi:hypothetical protein HLB44_05795 [Aquincola sp. S2]|uniref:Uncharacterized protein n=1 Tax=Pseudaquabacterium terrae TaxID=2732868 RepID=A0ABX2EC34_9BURK|nr:DUF1302 family protein [Aquabacterium terrae]NRF66488.1 hypothetical protein [Aquabacterium terrae]